LRAAAADEQPVTAIFVVCVITAPSCAVIVVGIVSAAGAVVLTFTVTFVFLPWTRRVTFLVTVVGTLQKLYVPFEM
jgi:hypothetical protein